MADIIRYLSAIGAQMTTAQLRRIAVIGAGMIGSALAGPLILAGNKVLIGARRPADFTPPDHQRDDIDYPVRAIKEAIDGAEVAILAIPNAGCRPACHSVTHAAIWAREVKPSLARTYVPLPSI
jgi:glycerol-3-phosphate dehydrogenase